MPKFFVVESFTVAVVSGTRKVWIRRGEYQGFPSKSFCLTVPKNFVVESFIAALNSGTDKVWIIRGGVSRFSVEVFLSHCAEKFRSGILYCCSSFGHQKSLDKKMGGGVSRFSVEKFLSHCAEKFRNGILYCCSSFGHQKSLDKKEGEYQGFPSKSFCLTAPKNFVGKSFTVALFSGTEEV